MCVYVCVYVLVQVPTETKRGIRSTGVRVVTSCQLPGVGTGTENQALCKNSVYYTPQSHLQPLPLWTVLGYQLVAVV